MTIFIFFNVLNDEPDPFMECCILFYTFLCLYIIGITVSIDEVLYMNADNGTNNDTCGLEKSPCKDLK